MGGTICRHTHITQEGDIRVSTQCLLSLCLHVFRVVYQQQAPCSSACAASLQSASYLGSPIAQTRPVPGDPRHHEQQQTFRHSSHIHDIFKYECPIPHCAAAGDYKISTTHSLTPGLAPGHIYMYRCVMPHHMYLSATAHAIVSRLGT